MQLNTKSLFVAAALAAFATPALASHCPADAAAIDAALTVAQISDEQKAEIVALRDEGLSLHESGNHGDSERILAEAMRLLLNGIAEG